MILHPIQKHFGLGIQTGKIASNGCNCDKCNNYFELNTNLQKVSHYEIVMWNGPHPFRKIFSHATL